MDDNDQALLARADRFIASPGGERERRRLLRALADRRAGVQARLDQLRERQYEILDEHGLGEPPA